MSSILNHSIVDLWIFDSDWNPSGLLRGNGGATLASPKGVRSRRISRSTPGQGGECGGGGSRIVPRRKYYVSYN